MPQQLPISNKIGDAKTAATEAQVDLRMSLNNLQRILPDQDNADLPSRFVEERVGANRDYATKPREDIDRDDTDPQKRLEYAARAARIGGLTAESAITLTLMEPKNESDIREVRKAYGVLSGVLSRAIALLRPYICSMKYA